MTALQKTIVAAAIAAAVGIGIYEARQNSRLRGEVQSLQEGQTQLSGQLAEANQEKERLSHSVVETQRPNSLSDGQLRELLKLRGVATVNASEIAQLKAALADQKEKIPESVASLLRKNLDAAAASLTRAQTNVALARVGRMSERLKLTPEQKEQVQAILVGNATARGEMELAHETRSFFEDEPNNPLNRIKEEEERALAAVLTPDQAAAYEQMKSDEDKAGVQAYVGYEASAMKQALGLSNEQAERLAAAFSTLARGEGGPGITYYSNARDQLEMRVRAFESVLTADQLQKYRQMKLEDIEQREAIRKLVTALKQ